MDPTYNLNGGFKPTMKRFADLDGPDFFPTPAWATHALLENEHFEGEVWECACGDGAMSRVLESRDLPVISSDLYERGYGESGRDFLTATRTAENIITNPPYNAAEAFVRVGLQRSRRKLAFCCALPSWRAQTGPGRSLPGPLPRGCGCSASGSRSTRPALK